jgi:hypothetical protein
VSTHQATCYLLLGGSEGMLTINAAVNQGLIESLTIEAQGGFGGPVWAALAKSLAGVSRARDPIEASIGRFQRAGLIPEELDLEPLVKTMLKFGT